MSYLSIINIRHLDEQLKTHFDKYKQTLALLGARQVGKTIILKKTYLSIIFISR